MIKLNISEKKEIKQIYKLLDKANENEIYDIKKAIDIRISKLEK